MTMSMSSTKGFVIQASIRYVYRLKKASNGAKKAPRAGMTSYQRFSSFPGFTKGVAKPTENALTPAIDADHSLFANADYGMDAMTHGAGTSGSARFLGHRDLLAGHPKSKKYCDHLHKRVLNTSAANRMLCSNSLDAVLNSRRMWNASKGRTVADSIDARLSRPTVYKFKTDCSIIPVWNGETLGNPEYLVLEETILSRPRKPVKKGSINESF
ncbi:hypothetical protein Tco_0295184 [Tanacetum coccineum]